MSIRRSTLCALAAALLATSSLAIAQQQPYYRSINPSFAPATPPGNPNGPGTPTDPETAPLEVSISSAPSEGMAGISIPSFGYSIVGGKGPYTVTVPGSPDLSASGGIVSGTPLIPGLYSYAVRVVDAEGTIVTADAPELFVHQAFAVNADGSTSIRVGEQATISISSTGGKAPVTYGVTGDSVPGMGFNGTALTGAPTTVGNYNFTLWAQDAFLGQRVERNRSLSVLANPYQLSIVDANLNMRPGDVIAPNLATNVPNPTFSVVGAPSYVTAHPAGLLVVSAPAVTERTSIPNFRVRAENAQNSSQYREIEVSGLGTIRPNLALANATVTGTIGQPITPVPFALSGAESPGSPSINGYNQLLGLSIVDGQIQGTPTHADTATRSVTYTDQADGKSVTATVNLSIAKTLTVTLPSTTSFTGTPGQTLTAGAASFAGNVGPVTWSIENATAGQPTTGFSISSTGVVSGSRAAAGSIQLYVTASETGQSTRSANPLTFNFQSADATVARPNFASVHSDSLGYGSGTLVDRLYDENDASGWTIYSGGYDTKPLTLTFNTATQVSCVKVRGSVGGGSLTVTHGGGTSAVGLYSSVGTVQVGLPPLSVNNVTLNFYNPTNGQHARIHEFQAGVMQSGVCVTAP